jgi:hypothetical protein
VTVQIINGKHKRDESLVFFVLIFILYQNWWIVYPSKKFNSELRI